MSINAVIPQLWAARLLNNLNNEHVYAACCNRDYEGEISNVGDTVRIGGIGRVTVSDYTRYSDISLEQLNVADQTLTIEKDKYFAFTIDDADKRQAKPELMDEAMGESAFALAEAVDDYVAAALSAGVATANQLTAATVGTGASDSDAWEILVDLGVVLDENNVPKAGRWVVIPPWYEGMLVKDPRASSFGTDRNRSVYANGDTGMQVAGFNIKRSNNVPTSGSAHTVIAGYNGATTFAEQLREVTPYRPEKRFEDAVKGRHMYGVKVTRPYGLASIAVTKAT